LGDWQPGAALGLGEVPDKLGVKIETKARAAAVGAYGVPMPEIVVEPALGHRLEKRRVCDGVEHILHVNVIEWVVP
jgi:hypothetical protein